MSRPKIVRPPMYGKLLRCTDIYRYIVVTKKRLIHGITNWYVDMSHPQYTLVVYFEGFNQPDQYRINTEHDCKQAVESVNLKLKEVGFR